MYEVTATATDTGKKLVSILVSTEDEAKAALRWLSGLVFVGCEVGYQKATPDAIQAHSKAKASLVRARNAWLN